MTSMLEYLYVSLLIFLTRLTNTYSLATKGYPLQSSIFRGITLKRKYLDKKYELSINLNSKSLIDHKILFTGSYEKGTNMLLEKLLGPGDVIIEAGANTGTETLLLSRLVGEAGYVYAFEPLAHIVELLAANCNLNNLKNVTIVKRALGESAQEIDFYMADESFTNQGMGTKFLFHENVTKPLKVEQTSLDTFLEVNRITKVDLIKMDIQGAEYDALLGAQGVIQKHKPYIFLEAGDVWSDTEQLFDFLIERGYNVSLVAYNGEVQQISKNNIKEGNWIAMPIKR